MTDRYLNGQSYRPTSTDSPNAILYEHAKEIGELKATAKDYGRRLDRLEDRPSRGLSLGQWVQLGIGIAAPLIAAAFKVIPWSRAIEIISRG